MSTRFGEFELDEEMFQLSHQGRPLRVQRRVLETILYLVHNHKRLVTLEDLHSGPWKGTTVSDAAVSQAIKQARKALACDPAGRRAITSVRGKGFRFALEVTMARSKPGEAGSAPENALLGRPGPIQIDRDAALEVVRKALEQAPHRRVRLVLVIEPPDAAPQRASAGSRSEMPSGKWS